MRRRKLLAGVAGVSTVPAFAGCLGGEHNDAGDEDAQTGVNSRDIRTLAQTEVTDPSEDERNVESTARVSGDAETVEIEGSLEAPTPCHEAVITDVSVDEDTLTVHVGLEDSSDADVCTQQISEVEYSATIVAAGEPTHVVVVHTDRLREETAADTEL